MRPRNVCPDTFEFCENDSLRRKAAAAHLTTSPLAAAEGSLRWHHGESASLALVPSLLSVDEVESVLGQVTSAALDTDADTVDEMSTYELYLTNQNARRREPSNLAAARAPLRNALNAFLSPIIEERITPFVAQRFAPACGIGSKHILPLRCFWGWACFLVVFGTK